MYSSKIHFNQNFNGKFILQEKDHQQFDKFLQKMGTAWIFRQVAPVLRQELHLQVPDNTNTSLMTIQNNQQPQNWININLISSFVQSKEKYILGVDKHVNTVDFRKAVHNVIYDQNYGNGRIILTEKWKPSKFSDKVQKMTVSLVMDPEDKDKIISEYQTLGYATSVKFHRIK